MNYITEIKLFNEWLETNELTTSGIALWYSLMYIANRSGWKVSLCIPLSVIMLRTKMSRSTIYRERESLRRHGLIDFDVGDGRQSSTYKIIGFEERFAFRVASHMETQDETQPGGLSQFASHQETQDEIQSGNPDVPEAEASRVVSRVVSRTETQDGTQDEIVSHTETQHGTIYRHKHNISLDKNKEIKGGSGEKRKSAKSPKKKKEGFDLSFIGEEVWESLVRTWLEYKQSRGEGYKSELSVKKFHTMLRNLSRGDPKAAAKIIDKSIARNWAGIFELTDEPSSRSGDTELSGNPSRSGRPSSGQRIGQIKQPEDEERRRKLLEKFDKKE